MRWISLALSGLLFVLAAAASARHAPCVLRTSPAQGAEGVACTGLEVRFTFSHEMDTATLNRGTAGPGYFDSELRFIRDPFLETAYRYEAETRTLIVSVPPLLPRQKVVFRLTDKVRSADGRPLTGEGEVRYELLFVTGERE